MSARVSRKRSRLIHRLRSTTSSSMRATWALGPPKPSSEIFSQVRVMSRGSGVGWAAACEGADPPSSRGESAPIVTRLRSSVAHASAGPRRPHFLGQRDRRTS